jgi:hypothetical protein
VDDAGPRDAAAVWTFGSSAVARTGYALELETAVMKPEALARLPAPKATLGARDLLRAIDALAGLDAEARARIGAAVASLADGVSRDAARDALPERLREPFAKLVEVGSRD